MSKVRWPIRITTEKPDVELKKFFENDDYRHEIKRVLALLANEDDPRSPKATTDVQVEEVLYDAPGCYRVKVSRYAIRIIFRLLVIAGDPPEIFEISSHKPPPAGVLGFIDILQVGFRQNVYGPDLSRRHLNARFPPYEDE